MSIIIVKGESEARMFLSHYSVVLVLQRNILPARWYVYMVSEIV